MSACLSLRQATLLAVHVRTSERLGRIPAPKREFRWATTTVPIPDLREELLDHLLTRHEKYAEKLLPRLRATDSTHSETPFRPRQSPAPACTAGKLLLWRGTFPNPSTSPARYTKSLRVACPQFITAADAEGAGWIPTFPSVVHSENNVEVQVESLALFHRLTSTVKSLHKIFITVSPSRIVNFIRSFLLLVDLSVRNTFRGYPYDGVDVQPAANQSGPPMLGGSLELSMSAGMGPIGFWLSLPGGLHFRKLSLTWNHETDMSFAAALVEKCCLTFESLKIDCGLQGTLVQCFVCVHSGDLSFSADELWTTSIDLSKTTRLNLAIENRACPRWVTMALRTVTPNHTDPQRISLGVPYILLVPDGRFPAVQDFRNGIGGTLQARLELDEVLVKIWELDSISLEVQYRTSPVIDGREV